MPQTVALDEIARDTIAQLAPLAHACRQEIGLSHVGPALSIPGEPALLGALLRNLIENALRHTPEGGEVDVSLREDNGSVVLEVRDTGPGIDPAHLGDITERFVRSHSQDTQGTGLGLAISAHIAGLHHALSCTWRTPHPRGCWSRSPFRVTEAQSVHGSAGPRRRA